VENVVGISQIVAFLGIIVGICGIFILPKKAEK